MIHVDEEEPSGGQNYNQQFYPNMSGECRQFISSILYPALEHSNTAKLSDGYKTDGGVTLNTVLII